MKTRNFRAGPARAIGLLCLLLIATAASAFGQAAVAQLKARVKHIVVIYQENWSFDALYGKFPGANGFANASAASLTQADHSGVPLTAAPAPINGKNADPAFAALDLAQALKPFDLTKFIGPEVRTGDLVHRFYTEQLQIDGGRMDRFVSWSDNGGLVMSYFDATSMPEGKLAQEFTLCDNFFHAAFGGSFLNHIFLVAAAAPVFPNAPASMIATPPDAAGTTVADKVVTPDGYVVNTAFSVNQPHPASADPSTLVPNQDLPTIGDRLSGKNISWAWYSGGWDDALAGRPDPLFQFHHQPFIFFSTYADGTAAKKEHLKDEKDFLDAVSKGTMPAVSFIKPLGPDNEHPGYAALARGQQHVADLVQRIRASRAWNDTVIIITYDEHGGRWDHVAPPVVDRWGPGLRVPAIIVSPMARKGYVDHTQYDTTSILKLIEETFGVAPLNQRDAGAGDLANALKL
ncbi:MAG TPA: alkaline phosphatase family protein [Spirochaetia bacterium]|nr:alkaline phosphatase family protein [Spirochaetia bacterium]